MTIDDSARSLDDTVAALAAGPTGLTPSAALATVDRWHAACLAEDTLDLSGIAGGLAALKTQLSGRLDGAALADTLARLGDDTTAAAAQVHDARLPPTLERLGATLTRFAGILA